MSSIEVGRKIDIIQQGPRMAMAFKTALEAHGFSASIQEPITNRFAKGKISTPHLALVDENVETKIPKYIPQVITGNGIDKAIWRTNKNVVGFISYKDFYDSSTGTLPPLPDLANYTAAYISRIFDLQGNHFTPTLSKGDVLVQNGDLTLNRSRNSLKIGTEEFSLTPTQAGIINLFLKNPGMSIPKAALHKEARSRNLVGKNPDSVKTHLSNLRERLGEKHRSRIQTVKGGGYKLLLETDE